MGYADDNGFVSSTDTQEELRALASEMDKQVLAVNRFSRPVKVGDVESQKIIKLLGIRMSYKMSLPQALEVVRKVTAKLPSVLGLKEWASKELLINTADSILMSHIGYGLKTYGGESRVLTLLQKCQNKVMRAILGNQLKDRVPNTEIGWNSVTNMMRYKSD